MFSTDRPPETLGEFFERLVLLAAACTPMIIGIKFLLRWMTGEEVAGLLFGALIFLSIIDQRRVQRVRFTDAGIDPQDGTAVMAWRDIVSLEGIYRNFFLVGLFARDRSRRMIKLATPLSGSTKEMLETIRDHVGPEVTMNGKPLGGRQLFASSSLPRDS